MITIKAAVAESKGAPFKIEELELDSPRRALKEGDPDFEKRRMGKLAVLPPGATTPVTVSWRGHAPTALRVGAFALPLR